MIKVRFGDKELKLKPSKELEDILYEFTDEYTRALLDISSKYNYYDARGWDSKAGSILTTHCGTKHLDRIERVSELLLQIPEYKKEYDKVRKDSELERIERGKQNFANMLSNLEEDFDVYEVSKKLKENIFIPKQQKNTIFLYMMNGEEKDHFADIVNELDNIVKNAPNLYETDGKKDKKPVLHYFHGNYDAYAYELDKQTGEMFGHVSLGYGYELGYFSMNEINSVPQIELDLYYDGELPRELNKKMSESTAKKSDDDAGYDRMISLEKDVNEYLKSLFADEPYVFDIDVYVKSKIVEDGGVDHYCVFINYTEDYADVISQNLNKLNEIASKYCNNFFDEYSKNCLVAIVHETESFSDSYVWESSNDLKEALEDEEFTPVEFHLLDILSQGGTTLNQIYAFDNGGYSNEEILNGLKALRTKGLIRDEFEGLDGRYSLAKTDLKAYNEKVEETKNYKRTRLEEPSTCKKGSFRTKQINSKGDKIVLCKDRRTGKLKAQSKLEKKHENYYTLDRKINEDNTENNDLYELRNKLLGFIEGSDLLSDVDDWCDSDDRCGIDIYVNTVDMLEWSKELYDEWYDFITSYEIEKDAYTLYFSSDGSGYDYWIGRGEQPHLALVIEMKNPSTALNDYENLTDDLIKMVNEYDKKETYLWNQSKNIIEESLKEDYDRTYAKEVSAKLKNLMKQYYSKPSVTMTAGVKYPFITLFIDHWGGENKTLPEHRKLALEIIYGKDFKTNDSYCAGNVDEYRIAMKPHEWEKFINILQNDSIDEDINSLCDKVDKANKELQSLISTIKTPKNESVPSKDVRRRISFEDDLVKVYDGDEEIYKGLEDYDPMKDDDWTWDEKDKSYFIKGTNYRKYCID